MSAEPHVGSQVRSATPPPFCRDADFALLAFRGMHREGEKRKLWCALGYLRKVPQSDAHRPQPSNIAAFIPSNIAADVPQILYSFCFLTSHGA